jgi:signal transduction histidine kinase
VLDLSKSESGKMHLDARPLDMAEVLADCVSMMREQCTAAGLAFSISAMGEMPMEGDPAKLRQIFLNLLSNAVKFTEKGGSVSLEAVASADAIAVTVGDTGIGMSAADVEIAFQPFGQVDNRLERKYEGTGLGLPLTKALVDLHGGTLAIDSARGAGTRITVTLPRRPANALAEAV